MLLPILDLGRGPTAVLAGLFRPFFTFVVPIALVANVPAKALLGLLEPPLLAYALGPALALLVAPNCFWPFSLRRSSGASS